MSTATAMARWSLAGRQQGRAGPPLRRVGRVGARRWSPPSPPPRWRRTSSATRARPTPCSRRSASTPATSGFGGDRRLALLDDELPDWNAFIAANLLVDGVLTTFVAACVGLERRADGPAREEDPPGGGLAPRARRGVGQAPVPRRRSATRSSRACRRPGSTPAAGSGPTTTPSTRPRWRPARSSRRPPHQRELMRALAHRICWPPRASRSSCRSSTDWSGWDPERRRWAP